MPETRGAFHSCTAQQSALKTFEFYNIRKGDVRFVPHACQTKQRSPFVWNRCNFYVIIISMKIASVPQQIYFQKKWGPKSTIDNDIIFPADDDASPKKLRLLNRLYACITIITQNGAIRHHVLGFFRESSGYIFFFLFDSFIHTFSSILTLNLKLSNGPDANIKCGCNGI